MNEKGMIVIGGKEHHISDLWLEIFKSGMSAHEDWKGKSDVELHVIFHYWLKEKLNTI